MSFKQKAKGTLISINSNLDPTDIHKKKEELR